MKKIKLQYLLPFIAVGILIQYSCNKSLELAPLDQLSDASYWQTPTDFMLATNAFYTYERTFNDVIFDNPHADQRSDFSALSNQFANGTNTVPLADANYNNAYSRIRNINYMLSKAAAYSNPASIKKYIAEAKFFRAYVYFDLLQLYGGVPLIDKPLDVNSPELQIPRASRDSVVDFIINDLNSATPDLPLESAIQASDKGRISQGAAQSFLSRVALYEGTWQKFSSQPNLLRANSLLDISIAASGAVINSNQYALFKPAVLGDSAQKYMFILEDEKSNPAGVTKASNKEYILANRYSFSLRQIRTNVSHSMMANVGVLTLAKKFANLYLCKDGLPIDKSPLFQGYSTMISEYQNRDNRMRYNMAIPGGYYWKGNANWRVDWVGGPADLANAFIKGLNPATLGGSGYYNQKWAAERQVADNAEGYDYPDIRYAEVLLNYAEAVYERNNAITDADLDKSLNLVRQRVNSSMPKLSNTFVTTNGLDLRTEIRRERSIELYLEGFRIDDLKRWHTASAELGTPVLGITWTGTQYQVTWPSAASIPKDANGNLIMISSRAFSEKNYLLPIPSQQIALNPNLVQNPGW
jgi:starch-binding outer membrane protein, SusD/RagB family